MVLLSPQRVIFEEDLLARQVDFGSDATVSKQSDKHVGVGAGSSLVAGDGHHLVHWRVQFRMVNIDSGIQWTII